MIYCPFLCCWRFPSTSRFLCCCWGVDSRFLMMSFSFVPCLVFFLKLRLFRVLFLFFFSVVLLLLLFFISPPSVFFYTCCSSIFLVSFLPSPTYFHVFSTIVFCILPSGLLLLIITHTFCRFYLLFAPSSPHVSCF